MRLRHFVTACAVSLTLLIGAVAQEKDAEQKSAGNPPQTTEKGATAKPPAETPKGNDAQKETAPIVTHHEIHVGGRVLRYTATTGSMAIRNSETDEVEANMFFVAYTLDNAGPNRPLMFSFNGGPGSASIWLHIGAIGPRRVKMLPDGSMPPPPFELIDNQQTWLDQTDLVFIDPVGTGFSRASKKDFEKKFYGLRGDISSVGEFIRLYLTRYQRWTSPLFLVGESYGTTRAAGLSGYLIDKGIALSGVVLVSSILNFQTTEFSRGNDLPYELYLPSYTSTAWFHKKLPPDLQQKDLQSVLREAEEFASGPYAAALGKGDNLSPQDRQSTIEQLARFTGLDRSVIEENDLRIKQWIFCGELLRHQRLIVGRLDSRFTGPLSTGPEGNFYDPTMAVIRPPFTATFNNYVRADLGYKTDVEYNVLEGLPHWDWGSAGEGFPDTSESLRQAFVKNPYMKLFVASGYYDLATPYFATQYTLSHMNLEPGQHQKITRGYYEAGHMMYLRSDSLDHLKQDVSGFLGNALQ
jgi:carboxypeptidase C (cathepsin A)